jgi:hypothetical protein
MIARREAGGGAEVAPVLWTPDYLGSRSPRWARQGQPTRLVELVRAGRSPEELAGEFEPAAQSIRNWVAQSARDAGRGDGGLTTAEPASALRAAQFDRRVQ